MTGSISSIYSARSLISFNLWLGLARSTAGVDRILHD